MKWQPRQLAGRTACIRYLNTKGTLPQGMNYEHDTKRQFFYPTHFVKLYVLLYRLVHVEHIKALNPSVHRNPPMMTTMNASATATLANP